MTGWLTAVWDRLKLPWSVSSREYSCSYENVLGTSLELRIVSSSPSVAEQAERTALSEIDRLEQIFSRYRPGSEFAQWQKNRGVDTPVSDELWDVLSACETWREHSRGAFHPATESLLQLWQDCAAENRLPTAGAIGRQRDQLGGNPWHLNASRRSASCARYPLSLHGIAKGYIVDRVCDAVLRSHAGVESVLLNVGGDLCVRGNTTRFVGIADPRRDAENAPFVATLCVTNGAMATSGDWRRGFWIGDTLYSHIIDGRTGFPASQFHSVSVLAPTAMEADVLSTIFTILSPPECAAMAESLPEVGYLLLARDGMAYQNLLWTQREVNE